MRWLFHLSLCLAVGLSLGACSLSRGAYAELSADGRQAERLAGLLLDAAGRGDPVLGDARPEMTALELALTVREASPAPEEPVLEPALLAAPDVAGGLGLLHAIHLASYREARHGVEGWHALRSQHASLSGLDARLVEADLGAQGVYLRLLAGPFDTRQAARAACGPIQSSGNWCAVLPFDGDPLIP